MWRENGANWQWSVEQYAQLDPANCVVVEDSRNGLLAATAAGMTCIVTYNDLTENEDFSEAAIVLSDFGEPGHPSIAIAQNCSEAKPERYFTADDLEKVSLRKLGKNIS